MRKFHAAAKVKDMYEVGRRKRKDEVRNTKYEVVRSSKFRACLPAGRFRVQNWDGLTSYFVPRTSSLNLEPCALSFFMEITTSLISIKNQRMKRNLLITAFVLAGFFANAQQTKETKAPPPPPQPPLVIKTKDIPPPPPARMTSCRQT